MLQLPQHTRRWEFFLGCPCPQPHHIPSPKYTRTGKDQSAVFCSFGKADIIFCSYGQVQNLNSPQIYYPNYSQLVLMFKYSSFFSREWQTTGFLYIFVSILRQAQGDWGKIVRLLEMV
jgi:hypothetical protein